MTTDNDRISTFEIYFSNWLFKLVGLLFLCLALSILVGPIILAVYITTMFDSDTNTLVLTCVISSALWGALIAKASEIPQARVINHVFNIFLSMTLHSERHRYFSSWDFDKPIKDQLHR